MPPPLIGDTFMANATTGILELLRSATASVSSIAQPLPQTPPEQPGKHTVGGLAARRVPGGTEVLYAAGGTIDDAEQTVAFNELYGMTIPDVPIPGTTPTLQFKAKFAPGGVGTPAVNSPVLTGLAFYADGLEGLLGVTRGSIVSGKQSRLVGINQATGTLRDVMNFTFDLGGALASAHDRGVVFLTGQVSPLPGMPPSTNFLMNQAVIAFDPRPISLYVQNTWWGSGGSFQVTPDTSVAPTLDVSKLVSTQDFTGAAYDAGRLTLTGRAGTSTPGQAVDFELVFNPGATGATGDPRITKIGPSKGNIVGLSEISNGVPIAPPVLDASPGGIDTTTINAIFARMAYSPQALQSGAIQAAFTRHFVNTAINPAACFNDPLVAMIPQKLLQNANKTFGIGRTSFDLRNPGGNPLPPAHPCSPNPAGPAMSPGMPMH